MRACHWLAVAVLSGTTAAHAESLSCNGTSAAEGDSRLSLLYKCGPPTLAQSYCAPVFYGPQLQPVPPAFVGNVAPCLPVEDWIYERGPGNLVATVRLRNGQIESIRYGRYPS